MAIEITEVKSPEQSDIYIKLPFHLNRENKIYVPPFIDSEHDFHDPTKNDLLRESDTIRFLAFENEECVGRIMGIFLHPQNEYSKTARFFQLDCTDSIDVCQKLLTSVAEWAKKKGATEVFGPYGFTYRDPQGLLIYGISHLPAYNAPALLSHVPAALHTNNVRIKFDLFSYIIEISKSDPLDLRRIADRVKKYSRLEILQFKGHKKLQVWKEPIRQFLNANHNNLFSYSPISKIEMDKIWAEYMRVLDPAFIKIATDQSANIAGLVIAVPNLSEGLKKCNGKSSVLNSYHLSRAKRKADTLDLILCTIDVKYRCKGLEASLMLMLCDEARKNGLLKIDSNLIHDTNKSYRNLMKRLGGQYKKIHRVFSVPLN